MIPHAPQVRIRTRAMELSRALAANGVQVDIYARNTQSPNLSLMEKIKWHWKEISSGFQFIEVDYNLQKLSIPTVHRINNLIKFTYWYSAQYLQNLNYDVIITSAYYELFFSSSNKNFLIYDLVDDHADGYRLGGKHKIADQVERFVNLQIEMADLVIASSKVLVDLAAKHYGKRAVYIPNGANVETIRNGYNQNANIEKTALRIGYIGGLEEFVRIDIVTHAVQKLRNYGIAAELIVVGDGPAVKELKRTEWLHLLGFKKPEEIPDIVQTFDIGVVPFTLSSFTDAALPLKVIEYGAARCLTISSPIKELQLQEFPWVELVPLEVESWVTAFKKLSTVQWESSWDSIVDQFDWKKIASQLLKAVAECKQE